MFNLIFLAIILPCLCIKKFNYYKDYRMASSTSYFFKKNLLESKDMFLDTSGDESKMKTQFNKISLTDITITNRDYISSQEKKDYWSVVGPVFHEQIVRIGQKNLRKRKNYSYKGKYDPMVAGLPTLKFIKEPNTEKYIEHAQHIKKGDWLKLDFNDTQFKRNVFKALRYKLIDSYELATVTLWYDAIQFLQNSGNKIDIRQFSFEEKGPYDPASINYSTPESLERFKSGFKKLPPGNNLYLTIDLPLDHEVCFFTTIITYYILCKKSANYMRNLNDIERYIKNTGHFYLTAYIKKLDLTPYTKKKLINHIGTMEQIESLEAIKDLLQKNYNKLYQGKTSHCALCPSYDLFVSTLILNEQNPSLVLSPSYNVEDPSSPVLSLVLPTAYAQVELLKSLHLQDTCYPAFVVGRFTPRKMVPFLTQFKEKKYRPIELVHPDIIREAKPHGCATSDFILTQHDWFHIWRSGANMYKNLFCHLIQSFQSYTRLTMSKPIWKLVDMDTGIGMQVRSSERNLIQFFKIDYLSSFFNTELGNNFWENPFSCDKNLLLIIDMIVNRDNWKKLLGDDPENFFPKATLTTNKWTENNVTTTFIDVKIALPYNYTNFTCAFDKVKKITKTNPIKNPAEAALIWILLLRTNNKLKDFIQKKRLTDIQKFFSWTPDGSDICLLPEKKKISELSANELYMRLISRFHLIQNLNGVAPCYPATFITKDMTSQAIAVNKTAKSLVKTLARTSKIGIGLMCSGLIVFSVFGAIKNNKSKSLVKPEASTISFDLF